MYRDIGNERYGLHRGSQMYNVQEYGAKGDHVANDTLAIQAAIEACYESGGGTVYFPAGDYMSGTLWLRDGVTLHLESGATLWTSADESQYDVTREGSGRRGFLLYAEAARDISITGSGTIRGLGDTPLGRFFGVPTFPEFRVGLLLFVDCEHVLLRDVTFMHSDAWTVHLKRCRRVNIDGITILNDIRHINSDGIDPNSCHDVQIANCHIVAGDDCIVCKATEAYPCENIVVTNCTMETTCTAIKLGTESHGDFRDIHFSNCTIRNTSVGIGFYLKDGATMERISFSNISIENLGMDNQRHAVFPIWMDEERRHPDSRLGKIRDIVFSNIQIVTPASAVVQGMPECSLENLTFRDITIRVPATASWAERSKAVGGSRTTSDERDTLYVRKPSYLTFAHVDGLTLDGVHVFVAKEAQNAADRAALGVYASRGVKITDASRVVQGGGSELPEVMLDDCQGVFVMGCVAQADSLAFLGVSGGKSQGIVLVANNLRDAGRDLVQGDDAPDGAVTLGARPGPHN